jgi:hypothetical protein
MKYLQGKTILRDIKEHILENVHINVDIVVRHSQIKVAGIGTKKYIVENVHINADIVIRHLYGQIS